MATASSSDTLAVADWDHGSETKSDRYLAARLAAAGADFKGVAVATFVLAATVGAVVQPPAREHAAKAAGITRMRCANSK